MTVSVTMHGPLFDGGSLIIKEWETELKTEYGRAGLAELQSIMDASFRNPTPYYETQVLYEIMGDDMVLHDRGIVYGPWLEGVGSRNATTRFKGYQMFRRTLQYLREDTSIIAGQVLTLIRRLNG